MIELSSDEFEDDEEDPLVAIYGPAKIPGTGRGIIKACQRELIEGATGCRAATRKRDGWESRMLTISGPPMKIQTAKAMAVAFLLENQKNDVPEGDTPGSEADPQSTPKQAQIPKSNAERRKRKRENRKKRENEQRAAETLAFQQHRQAMAQQQQLHQWQMMMGYAMPPMPPPGLAAPAFSMVPPGYTLVKNEPGMPTMKKEVKKEKEWQPKKMPKATPFAGAVPVKIERQMPPLPENLRPTTHWVTVDGDDDGILEERTDLALLEVVRSDRY